MEYVIHVKKVIIDSDLTVQQIQKNERFYIRKQ